jgi:hypothetical protein
MTMIATAANFSKTKVKSAQLILLAAAAARGLLMVSLVRGRKPVVAYSG